MSEKCRPDGAPYMSGQCSETESAEAACPPRTELLAPAGDGEAMRAAIANGADAVYFGLSAFNARRRAANFTLQSLDETINLLHRHGLRGYITLNTLIMPDELPQAADFLRRIAQSGADAVIVQDVGLARLAREMAPALPLHASTQMTLSEPEGINLVAGELGLSRVILPRELSLEEIRAIRRQCNVELEVFVHGALCISYSGQCLASQWLFGRSANRGMCAQPCRLPHKLLIDRQAADEAVPYALSPYDLAAHGLVADLVKAGATGLKIEGRLKNPHYVAAVVQLYRAALDAALADRPFEISPAQRAALDSTFSRGFCAGYLGGETGGRLVGGRHSAPAGVHVGRIIGRDKQRLLVEMKPADANHAAMTIAPGDGIAIVDEHGGLPLAGGRVYAVDPVECGPGAPTVALSFGSDFIALTDVAAGATVYRTDDPQMSRTLRKSYSRLPIYRPLIIDVTVTAIVGQGLIAQARTADGLQVRVEDAAPLEAARSRPATAEMVREQFDRLGDSGYQLGNLELLGTQRPPQSPESPQSPQSPESPEQGDAVATMIPKSRLNNLRRQLVEALDEQRRRRSLHTVANPQALQQMLGGIKTRALKATAPVNPTTRLNVLVRNLDQVEGLAAATGQNNLSITITAIVDAPEPDRAAMVERLTTAGVPTLLATTRLLKTDGHNALKKLISSAPHGLLVRHAGSIAVARRLRADLPLLADFSMNVANPLTADWLLDAQGVTHITPAAELSPDGLRLLAEAVGPGRLEIILHRRAPLMHTAHCLAAAHAERTAARASVGCRSACRNHSYELVDRIGEKLPVRCDENHHNTIFAPMADSAAADIGNLLAIGVTSFRLELLDESANQVRRLVDAYASWIASGKSPANAAELIAQMGLPVRKA